MRDERQKMKGKLIVFCAPSGTGKSTVIQWLMTEHRELNMHFSVSATSRPPRGQEQNGVEYFFKTPDEFRQLINEGAFVEYEEVYTDFFYGTLRSQVDSQLERGENVVFDLDVNGGERIKNEYGERALSVFIMPPSIDELRRRLIARNTDSAEKINERIARAEYELGEAEKFDVRVMNDDLEQCKERVFEIIKTFLEE